VGDRSATSPVELNVVYTAVDNALPFTELGIRLSLTVLTAVASTGSTSALGVGNMSFDSRKSPVLCLVVSSAGIR
jgi:hypothetical protein